MSNFHTLAKRPGGEKLEPVLMEDDFFGKHAYGVRFDDGAIYPEEKCSFEETPTPRGWEEEVVEKGAEMEHDRWSGWQKHMFSKGTVDENGVFHLPKEFVDRWFRQIDTPYSELSESEKESDRKETRNYIPLVQQQIDGAEKRGLGKGYQIGVIGSATGDFTVEKEIEKIKESERKRIVDEVEKMKDDLDYDGAVFKQSVIKIIKRV